MADEYTKLYRIKPLEWGGGEDAFGDVYLSAASVFGVASFTVSQTSNDNGTTQFRWGWCFDEYYDEGFHDCDSIEDGKAKAEAYYLERIKAGLVEVEA